MIERRFTDSELAITIIGLRPRRVGDKKVEQIESISYFEFIDQRNYSIGVLTLSEQNFI
jgi:hypothetical protein